MWFGPQHRDELGPGRERDVERYVNFVEVWSSLGTHTTLGPDPVDVTDVPSDEVPPWSSRRTSSTTTPTQGFRPFLDRSTSPPVLRPPSWTFFHPRPPQRGAPPPTRVTKSLLPSLPTPPGPRSPSSFSRTPGDFSD